VFFTVDKLKEGFGSLLWDAKLRLRPLSHSPQTAGFSLTSECS